MRAIVMGLALAVATVPALAWAQPTPATVLQAAKDATGGRAWDGLTGSYEKGAHGATQYETWLDFRRYGMRVESLHRGVKAVRGFNGQVDWRSGPDGTKASRDPADLREAVLTAFVSNNGFFFPDRFKAASRYVRNAEDRGRRFHVLEVSPEGGRPAELWFDQETHLLARIVDRAGPQPITVEISDYRKVGEVLVAFRGTVKAPDGKVLDEGVVESVEHRPVAATRFDPPGN